MHPKMKSEVTRMFEETFYKNYFLVINKYAMKLFLLCNKQDNLHFTEISSQSQEVRLSLFEAR